jgi:4-amino-4-deoxy-L-arabinose transferase-like glycosyltransferase
MILSPLSLESRGDWLRVREVPVPPGFEAHCLFPLCSALCPLPSRSLGPFASGSAMAPSPRTGPGRAAGSWTVSRISWILGGATALAVALTLGDPGITCDEPLDVGPGRRYVATLWARGWGFFDRRTGEAVGVEPGGPDPFGVHAGRLAPALAFAVLVGAMAREAGRRYGRAAAAAAGFALLVMPRAFAHGHLAALDTFVCLSWTTALLAAVAALEGPRPARAMAGAGVAFGLALLTKIHAWLLPPIVLAWALSRLRPARAVAAVAAWAGVGLAVFGAGWPWLWYDTLPRLRAFLGTGIVRATIRVQYLGQVYDDRAVPWHYPWLYFAATVPIGLQVLGALGLARAWRRRREDRFALLLAATIALVLALFSTRVPVYDGERLFLLVFPLWAILIGLGFDGAWLRAGRRAWARGALLAALLGQGYGVVALHPFGLSYYNALVGGLPGAERLGLELTYWGDAIDPVLLGRLADEARPGQVAALAPTLHHQQATAALTAALHHKQIVLADESAAGRAPWLLVYRRSAYWTPPVVAAMRRGRLVAERSRQGVWLSRLWHLPAPVIQDDGPASGGPPAHFRPN